MKKASGLFVVILLALSMGLSSCAVWVRGDDRPHHRHHHRHHDDYHGY